MRNRIDHWCTVEPGNPNPRVHRSSGKLGEASFPTGTVDPRVGISLSPLNTNDGFSLSTKVLDQLGRTGAYDHYIRRKATMVDIELDTVNDVAKHTDYLPITGDGV